MLSDEVNERDYAFTVKNVVNFTSGVYVFLDRDVMQELFDQEDDYYNVVFADHALDIDNGRLYATVSKENVEESSQIFTDMMGPMGGNARGNICADFYDRHVPDDESDDRSFRLFHFTDESIRLP